MLEHGNVESAVIWKCAWGWVVMYAGRREQEGAGERSDDALTSPNLTLHRRTTTDPSRLD
jgi:hypothetical protein